MKAFGATLAGRITAVTLLVALVAALVAALAATRLLTVNARALAQGALALEADTLAVARPGAADRVQLTPTLRDQGVTVVTVRPDGELVGAPSAVAAARQAGLDAGPRDLSGVVVVERTTVLVEARALGEGGFALVEPYTPGLRGPVLRAVTIGAVVGLLGAGIAGGVLSGVLSRPLRRAAAVARRMREGHRDLRVPVEGPVEVADVAASLNDLADSLARSEDRQRAFLHSVSHELRTPLTAVRGFAESIADGVTTGDEARRAAGTILAESERLGHLVDDLLDLARLGADDFSLDLADVDLAEVVRTAAEVWVPRGRAAGVDVQVLVPGAAPVHSDARRLRQVLDLLADNALRVTPAGQPLVIEVRRADDAPDGPARSGLPWAGAADGPAADPGPSAVLEVRDGGPGLAPADYPVAFERGTLHSRYRDQRAGGSGIGLSLAAGLVTRLGGQVSAHPAPEGGAAFRVALPLRSDGAAGELPAQASR